MARVVPPLRRDLARGRNHPREENQRVGAEPIRDQRRGEGTVGMANDDKVPPVADGRYHGVGVINQSRGVVIARQVRRDRIVPTRGQFTLQEMPVPSDISATVYQDEGSHPRA